MELAYSATYFYIRNNLWRTLLNHCENNYKKFNDPFFIFWKSFALYKEGEAFNAASEINKIRYKKEIEYSVINATILYGEESNSLDSNAV